MTTTTTRQPTETTYDITIWLIALPVAFARPKRARGVRTSPSEARRNMSAPRPMRWPINQVECGPEMAAASTAIN